MKKKILASLLLSTILVSQGAVLSTVKANSTDDKIAAQDNKINELTAQQADAQKQVDAIQKQVSAIQTEQEKLQAENERLQAESKQLEGEITELSKNIVARNTSLENQARSAQTNGAATSYINTIINSKSITEAISRVAAMSEIVSANNKMLAQQKEDKKAIAEKQVANNEAINTVIANQQTLAASANTSFVSQVQATSTSSSSDTEESSYTPTPTVSKPRPTYNTSASTYPVGQCTWGAKTLCPWAGDFWGNGGQWATSAAAAGFRTGSTPQVGAIICWNDGGYGHVAVVTAVESATRIQVSEANYDGSGTQPIGNYRGWFNPHASRGSVSYIYPN